MPSNSTTSTVRYIPLKERPDKYRVGDDGTIQSLGKNGWQDMKSYRSGKGDHVVGLSLPGGYGATTRFKVAHAVLKAFVGPRPPGLVCRHLDGNRDNNRVTNLAWGTNSQNVRDSIVQGTHGITRLTPDLVRAIRASGDSAKVVAGKLGVHLSVIYQVRTRKTWAWVD